jgi:hypothetical protein
VQPDDDAYWRRPTDGASFADGGSAGGNSVDGNSADGDSALRGHGSVPGPAASSPPLISLRYQGPPLSNPPPAGWRPTRIVEPAPPRRLPEQNHAGMDEQEARARTLSLGLAIVASAVLVIILCAVCGRTLF